MRTNGYMFKTALAMLAVLFGVAFASAQRAAPIDVAHSMATAPAPAPAGKPAGTPRAEPAARTQAAAQPPAGNFVGDDTCITCHETQAYKNTTHGRTFDKRTPLATGHGCESCHGSGQAHVDAGGDLTKILNPAKVSPERASEMCVTCHDRGQHALWDGSQHDQRKMGCVSCHSVHASKGGALLKAKDETTQCASCHRTVAHKQMRFNHMPLREGKMTCSSCHNVHGSSNVKLLKTKPASVATPRSAARSCGSTRRSPKAARRATIRTARTTSACWWPSSRTSASAATSRRGIRRPSTTGSC